MFNISEIYKTTNIRGELLPNFKDSVIINYKNNCPHLFYDYITKLFNPAICPKAGKRFFFLGHRFRDLIFSLPKEEVCIIGGPAQLAFCLKYSIDYIPSGTLWRDVYTGFLRKNDNRIIKSSNKLLETLSTLKINNSIMIVDKDSLPIGNILCQIASNANIRTVCIQHGIFLSSSSQSITDGMICDISLCYDEIQRRILIESGQEPEKVQIGGFYRKIKKSTPRVINRKICFLGQPWFKYNKNQHDIYLSLIMKIQEELASIGYQISYKPHPWEKGAAYLELFPIICNEEINEVIEEYDIFLSFTSTALIEASLAGKIAIQIHDVAFNADRFDDLGYSYCIDSSDIENSLIGFLDQEPYPIKMDEFYSLAKKISNI
ncbi:hypothetical protein [Erwinia sp. HR93]|uniref:hypothetical protein n=1 Tax=Erwinia sp. HR93 TaxID=3094840 RepID=UPI002ADEC728|nr:hypothetical protein [Erwinia sp. HR93]MEA1064354.1 hypothetical protein [Erwinia sp. HR93]